MYILGFNFGHDSSLTLIRDGVVAAFYEKERFCRTKHVLGLTADDVAAALSDAGVSEQQIDYVAVGSTQGVEYLFFEPERLSFDIDRESQFPSSTLQWHRRRGTLPKAYPLEILPRFKSGEFRRLYAEPKRPIDRDDWVAHDVRPHWARDPDRLSALPSMESFLFLDDWIDDRAVRAGGWQARFNRDMALGFHLPIKMNLLGRPVPGILASHHFAHAAYAHVCAGVERTLVFSHDGGLPDDLPYASGMVYWGEGSNLYPIAPHHLNLGYFYDSTATLLGFDIRSGAGKLMGLASYGEPEFFKAVFGSPLPKQKEMLRIGDSDSMVRAWMAHLQDACAAKGLDVQNVGVDNGRILNRETTSIASSAQAVFEHGIRSAVSNALAGASQSGLRFDCLALTGGAALNCPANSSIYKDLGVENVSVLPGAIDAGISIGAALALYHVILGHPLCRTPASAHQGYLGAAYTVDAVRQTLQELSERIEWVRPGADELLGKAVEDLQENRIIGWFEGKSEIGPRALGHRSILANPAIQENWKRVNAVKGREWWRPFAPIVLQEHAERLFEGAPSKSEFMLFTHKVKSDELPAVTHRDGTSRVQTVDERSGQIHRLLVRWLRNSGSPVLLNTSFNGPGEPIVETPRDAINCLLRQGLDRLYIEGFVVTPRRKSKI